MSAYLGFGCRREDRFGQLFGLLETFGQFDAAHAAGGLVILPAAADDVTAGNAFDEDGL